MNLVRIDMHPHGGVAGDMFAAAMSDAFPELQHAVFKDIDSLEIPGLSAGCTSAMSAGLRALRFDVTQNTNIKPPRTLAAVIDFFAGTELGAEVVEVATAIYRLLAQAEADVHGKTIETIHFHEVSDWDSMVDIVAASGFIARLGCPLWRLAPLPLGGGSVNTAHGDIPVPAPATLALLDGYAWVDDGVAGERVTPTGAAIMRYLQPEPIGVGGVAASLASTGQGCGTRELAGRANVFRVSCYTALTDSTTEDQIVELAFEVDDMTGEELAVAMQHLRDHTAVLDLSSLAMTGKKGRPVVGLRLQVVPEHADGVVDLCFRWTTTLGIRRAPVMRHILRRAEHNTDHAQVKTASRPGGAITAKAASDDLAAASSLQHRRQLAAAAEQQALAHHEQPNE